MSEHPSVDRCLVYCRLRPETQAERDAAAIEGRLLELAPKSVNVSSDKNYQFDGTFSGDSTQEQLFDSIGRPVVEHCLAGYKSALMAYGQTGTGKSFTMCCTKPGLEGIIPRAAQLLFDTIEKRSEERSFSVQLQFLQIYRDNLGDLMTETGRDRVDIFFDKNGVTLPGCSIHEVKNTAEFMDVYNVGNARRVTTATAMNPESSRGHSALLVWVSSVPKGDNDSSERKGKITFIDLAGYERFSKTGISNSNPVMKDEAKTINASLLSLGHVVSALSNGDKHIPWRNSKLTRLLQDSIGGRSRTTIILTVGPSAEHVFETTNTLQFGQRAMAVKVQAKTTETVDYARLAAKLQSMLNEKEERINALELQAASFDVAKNDLLSRHERDLLLLRNEHQQEIERLRSEGASDERILKIVSQHEVERENLIEQQKEEVQYNNEQNETTTKEIVDNLAQNYETEIAEMKLRIEELEILVEKKDVIIADLKKGKGSNATSNTVSPTATPRIVETSTNMIDLDEDENNPAESSSLKLTDLSGEEPVTLNSLMFVGNEQERLKSAQLQAEVDRLTCLCNQRAEDLVALKSYVSSIKLELLEAIDGEQNNSDSLQLLLDSAPRVSDIEMVDKKIVDEKERDWGEKLAQREEEVESLRQEIAILRNHVQGGALGGGMTPRIRSSECHSDYVPLPLTARGTRTQQRRGMTVQQSQAIIEQQRIQIDMLREELENANAEVAILYEAAEEAGIVEITDEGRQLVPDKVIDELQNARSMITSLKAQLTTQTENQNNCEHPSERKVNDESVEEKLAAAEAAKTTLSTEIGSLKEEIEALRREATSRDAEDKSISSELVEAKKALENSCVAVDELTDKLAAAEAAKTTLSTEIGSLKEEIEALRREATSRDAEDKSISSELVEAKKAHENSCVAVDELTDKLAAAEAAKTTLSTEIGSLKEEIEALRREATSRDAEDKSPQTVSKENSCRMQEDMTDILKSQRDLFKRLFAGDKNIMYVALENNIRQQNSDLVKKLADHIRNENESLLAIEVLKEQLRSVGIKPKNLKESFLPNQVSKIIENTDLNLISVFKESELQLLHNRLEIREKSMYDLATHTTQLTQHISELKSLLQKHAPDIPIPVLEKRLQYDGGDGEPIAVTSPSRKESTEIDSADLTRTQLEGLLWLTKAMRKQNALLQTTVMERSIMIKHYAWMLMTHQTLPEDFNPESIVGTIASDLRLAFAERDEELATRDQQLLQRSTELIVLEESVTELHAQLTTAGLVPCRPASKLATLTLRNREEMQDELSERSASKSRLITQRLDTIAEITKVEDRIKILCNDATNVELLLLRSRSDQLRSSLEVTDAKIKSQEREIEMLQHLIGQSFKLVVDMQAQKDLDADLSVVEKFKARFLKK